MIKIGEDSNKPRLDANISTILFPGVYAYFMEIIKFGKNDIPFFQNIRKHIFNYIIVTILIGIPIFIFILFGNSLPLKEKIIVKTILIAAILKVI